MKRVFIFLLLLKTCPSFAQKTIGFSEIDWRVQTIDAPSPDSLAKLLTTPYSRDIEKARAIYSWIAQHISYNTYVIKSSRYRAGAKYIPEPDDTSINWKSANEMTAIKTLKKRSAVCDGYAKLFKTLCDYAGLRSEVITGYARGYIEGENKFRSNHTWNAVMIDSTWKLIDVTWGSGFVTFSDAFVQRMDGYYFLTPPEQFIQDHYPEELEWSLLPDPPTIREFKRMPFRCKSFIKYSISSYAPAKGVVEASIGDTIQIEVYFKDQVKDRRISPDPFFDSATLSRSPYSLFLSPTDTAGNKFLYTYVVTSEPAAWLNIVYNKDVIMRYRLNLRKDIAAKLD